MVIAAIQRLETNIAGQLWDAEDVTDIKLVSSALTAEMRVIRILTAIAEHHQAHPDHGIDCACMDEHIWNLRRLTEIPFAQWRIDYVLRKVLVR